MVVEDGVDASGAEDVPEGIAFGNGATHHEIDVPPQQFVGMHVVAAEHEIVGIVGEKGCEGFEVLCGAALADEHFHAHVEASLLVGQGGAFVVGGDALRGILLQLAARQPRCMAVDGLACAVSRSQLAHHLGIARQNARHVHHLAQEVDVVALHERVDVGCADDGSAGLHVCAGYAGGGAEEEMEGYLTAVFNHEVDAVDAEHIGYLVRVGNGGQRAVTDGDTGKVLGQQHAALDVDVAVDESGKNVGGIIFHAVGRKDRGDAAVGNG